MFNTKHPQINNIVRKLGSFRKFCFSVEAFNHVGEELSVMIVQASQFGYFLTQGIHYFSSQVCDSLQCKLTAWRLGIALSLIYTPDILESAQEKKRPFKKVVWEGDQQIYNRFFGFEGLGMHLFQNTNKAGRLESISLGLWPLCSVSLSVWALDHLSNVSIEVSVAQLGFEFSLSVTHPEDIVACDHESKIL
jgi:hypothetical protein